MSENYPVRREQVGPNEYDYYTWCQTCEEEISTTDAIWHDEIPVCEKCENEVTCIGCNDKIHKEDAIHVDNEIWCADCMEGDKS
ncbi:MAG: hypothetical protein GY861_14505 [bacterium]|nr:hypothetical protein [bacterium]